MIQYSHNLSIKETDSMKRILPIFFVYIIFSVLYCSADPLDPDDLKYRGAFRLPEGERWEYSGYAMTYCPVGDAQGPEDGYPGSIFIIGHDHHQEIAEISIPVPMISLQKEPSQLNVAHILQGLTDIKGDMFEYLEIPRAGLAYMGDGEVAGEGKLYFCWGQHFQDNEPSHGWCETDLSDPQTKGPWLFGDLPNYTTNDYLFDVPSEWADINAPGKYLASGRFRDGHWSGRGPALFIFQPPGEDDAPEPGSKLENIIPLLLYGTNLPGAVEITNVDSIEMEGFGEADEWSGGAWLTSPGGSAIIFAGTKAVGKNWYGFSNGVEWPTDIDENTVYPEVPEWPFDDRGWWSGKIQAEFIFFDPADLVSVAKGEKKPYEPQPYATLEIDEYLFDPELNMQRSKRYLLGAICFDREHGFLYVVERRADEERSLIHVWQIEGADHI
jgi:hypothetical protein